MRADVYRNQARGNPLPTFFARILGIANQGVQATATARVLVGNSASCMRPWALTDKWYDAVDTDAPIEGTPPGRSRTSTSATTRTAPIAAS